MTNLEHVNDWATAMGEPVYQVVRITKGNYHRKAVWQARVEGYPVVGSGSRPDLAIRDWKEQFRRWTKAKGE